MTLEFYRNFNIWPLYKLILLLSILYNFMIKVIKLLYDIPKANTNCLTFYHVH